MTKRTIILKLIPLLLCGTLAFPSAEIVDTKITPHKATTKLKAPLLNLFETTQWGLFIREFEMTADIGLCCKPNDVTTCAFGFKARMIEPIGYMETTKKPLHFTFADLDLGGNPIKGNSFFEHSGNTNPRGVAYDAHFIYVPIMGMIFKKKLSFVCFHEGDLLIPYMSEFDPTWKNDAFYMKMIPHMVMLFTPEGLVSSILDCAATEIVNGIVGNYGGDTAHTNVNKDSITQMLGSQDIEQKEASKITQIANDARDTLNMIRDTMYHVDGCNGFSPVGGYVNGHDPITDSSLIFHGIMGLLHGASALSPVPFLYKQTNMKIEYANMPSATKGSEPTGLPSSAIDTMCRWADYPLPIPSQYLLQLAYPTVGTAKEVGSSGASSSTAKNVPGSYGPVHSVWVRRDYYAFAYFCQNKEEKEEVSGESSE